jgi:hypothetical protein
MGEEAYAAGMASLRVTSNDDRDFFKNIYPAINPALLVGLITPR